MKSHTESALSEIDEELKNIAQKIGSEDFSQRSNKEGIRRKVVKNIRQKEVDKMKKSRNFKRPVVAVASVIVAMTLFTQTTIAKDLAYKIREIFSLGEGRINIVQEEPIERGESTQVPDSLKGKIFDEQGRELKELTEDIKKIYTESGEEIAYIENGDSVFTLAQQEGVQDERTLVVRDINERNNYTSFEVKVPDYLPEGYKFDRIEFYKDEEGKVEQSKYINIYYVNESTDNFIHMQQRVSEEEAGYTTGTEGSVEKVRVNGAQALLMDNESIHWEADGVLYYFTSRGAFGRDEIIQMAESMK